MKHLLLILLLMFSVGADSEEPIYTTVFTSLCISDQNTGFKYVNSRWKKVSFVEHRWTMQKVNINQHLPVGYRRSACQNKVDEAAAKDKALKERSNIRSNAGAIKQTKSATGLRQGCYRIDRFGAPILMNRRNWERTAVYCGEELEADGRIKIVDCGKALWGSFRFQPTGEYVHGAITGTDFDFQYRDSLVVEVGRCSLISGSTKIHMPE
tara:strand:+ start:1548 stop:2177 length:630 start_codon:yes stop_codon:yes gene_type:complete